MGIRTSAATLTDALMLSVVNMRKRFSALEISRLLLEGRIHEGDICIDATMGRGYDTLYLCGLVGSTGKVIAFDIQEDALNSTKELLEEHGMTAELHQRSHEHMDEYADEGTVSCVMFNLGWLPRGDHNIHTDASSTITAISKAMGLLKEDGVICVIIYYGRETGYEEKEQVLSFLRSIDSGRYSVVISEFANRPNDPPIPCFIFRQ